MADISKIKVSGVTYNIKDIPGRNSGYLNVVCTWDGNIEGLESIQIGALSYYRIRDSVQTNNYLIGEMVNLNKQLNMDPNKMIELKLLTSVLGNISLYASPISLKHKFQEMVFSELFSNLNEEALNEIQTFTNNNHIGLWAIKLSALFLNIPITTTLSPALTKILVGVEKEIIIPEGFWVTSIEMGEEFGYRTYPVFPSIIYETTPSTTLCIDHAISSHSAEGHSITVSSSGLSSYEIYCKRSDDYIQTRHFDVDQAVYIKCTMQSSSYEITEITATGNSGTSYSLEETSGNSSGSNIKWYKFYMPNENVSVHITAAAAPTTTAG